MEIDSTSADMSEHDSTQIPSMSSHATHPPSPRQVYAHELRAGPTAALEHLRLLWDQRPPGDLSPDCELVAALTALRERFVNPKELENWGGRGIVRDIDELGADLWAACIQCNLVSLLLDMAKIDNVNTQPRVRAPFLRDCTDDDVNYP